MQNILKKLKSKLISYLLGDEVELVLLQQEAQLKATEARLRSTEVRNDMLEMQIAKLKKPIIPVVGFDNIASEPQDTKQRLQYCADVKVFYDNILNSKIKNGVAETRHLLSNVNKDESMPANMSRAEYDMFVRGMEAGFWAINDWCIRLSGELEENKYTILND